jgi:2-polyprenyl-6-methoxyphenol hydroxylase-like FAD-dependent oxidoreductase
MVDVVIAGAGPNGLMLACELGLAGIRPVVLDPLPGPNPLPRANGIVGQGVRILDHRGLYEPLAGTAEPPQPAPGHMFGAFPLDFSAVPQSQVYRLMVPQPKLVQVLAGRAAAYHADIRWAHALTGFDQHADGITAQVSGPDGRYELTAAYLVGADGGTSPTRKLAGIDFPGTSSHDVIARMAADVLPPAGWVDPETGALDVPGFGRVLPLRFARTERGLFIWASFNGRSMIGSLELDGAPDDDRAREEQAEQVAPLTLPELQASIERVLGVDVPLRPPASDAPVDFRRFAGINSRIASRYTAGRVILVGDAAHVHSALGGPGLNVGLQDAVNLGWKLAGVLQGRFEPALLETYEAERRPVAERVIMHSRAQLALVRPGSEVTALRELFGELLADPHAVRRLNELLSGADVRYPTEPGAHSLVGRWVPDLTIEKPGGASRVAELGRDGRPLLLDFTGDGVLAAAANGIRDGVTVVAGRPVEPVAASALLVRPDGYVAWAWSATESAELPDLKVLDRVLRHWFGIAALGSQGASSISA